MLTRLTGPYNGIDKSHVSHVYMYVRKLLQIFMCTKDVCLLITLSSLPQFISPSLSPLSLSPPLFLFFSLSPPFFLSLPLFLSPFFSLSLSLPLSFSLSLSLSPLFLPLSLTFTLFPPPLSLRFYVFRYMVMPHLLVKGL